MAPLCSALGNTYPIKLLDSGVNDGKTVSFGEPRAIYDSALNKYICLFQQGDGNFRVLRSATIQDCEDNVGTLLYHSDFSVPGSGPYFTSMQVDGNLITRKQVNEQWVWKTHSSQGMIEERFCLVLNADGTLSILDENDNTIWNSEMDEVRFFNRPLRLMTTLPDNPSRAWFIRPIKVRDALQGKCGDEREVEYILMHVCYSCTNLPLLLPLFRLVCLCHSAGRRQFPCDSWRRL